MFKSTEGKRVMNKDWIRLSIIITNHPFWIKVIKLEEEVLFRKPETKVRSRISYQLN